MDARVEIRFGPEWERTAQALSRVEKALPLNIDRTVKKETDEAVDRAQAAIQAMPTHGKKHRGTRATVARGTRARRIALGHQKIETHMPPGQEMLPLGFATQWHHPTYGGKPIVLQAPHYDWFYGPIASVAPDMHDELKQDLEWAVQHIADAG